MEKRRRMAAVFYAVTAVASIGLGGMYLLRSRFMPYHADALGSSWEALDRSEQVLIGALMDVAGAGWAVIGLVTLVLLAIPFRRGELWSRLLIPAMLGMFYLPNLLATLAVLQNTPAAPPWYGNAVALISILCGLAADGPWRRNA